MLQSFFVHVQWTLELLAAPRASEGHFHCPYLFVAVLAHSASARFGIAAY